MADDQVLKQSLQLRREIRNQREFGLQHLELDDHVPEQLPTGGVGEGPIVGQLVNLADIVQKRTREDQIPVHLRVVAADQVTRPEKRYDVIQQATDISMMQCFRGWRIAVGLRNFRIGHESLNQPLQMLVLKARYKVG